MFRIQDVLGVFCFPPFSINITNQAYHALHSRTTRPQVQHELQQPVMDNEIEYFWRDCIFFHLFETDMMTGSFVPDSDGALKEDTAGYGSLKFGPPQVLKRGLHVDVEPLHCLKLVEI